MIENARSFILEKVDKPALAHPDLDSSVKNKVRNTKQFVEHFKKVGDLYTYLKRFAITPDGTEDVYSSLSKLGLLTYEDILSEFEQRYHDYLDDVTSPSDFTINNVYTSWDLAIVSKAYDLRKGIYLVRDGNTITSILIKATIEHGRYPNRWIREPDHILCIP